MSLLGMRTVNSLIKPNHDGKHLLFGVSVAVTLSFVLKWWLDHVLGGNHTKKNRAKGLGMSVGDLDSKNALKEFEEMAATMRESKTKLSTADKLLLYGLYKQATKGDAPLIAFSLLASDQAKNHAWGQNRGMKKEVAARQYVEQATVYLRAANEGNGNASRSQDFGAGVSSRPLEEAAMEEASMNPVQRFFVAAGQDDVETLRKMLESKTVRVDETDDGGQTALHLAADSGSIRALELLLQHGANASAADQYGISVLQAAVIAGNIKICKLLLEHGADPDQADQDGDTPRNCAEDDGSQAMRLLFGITGGDGDISNVIESVIEEEDDEDGDDEDGDDEDGDNEGHASIISSVRSLESNSSYLSPRRKIFG